MNKQILHKKMLSDYPIQLKKDCWYFDFVFQGQAYRIFSICEMVARKRFQSVLEADDAMLDRILVQNFDHKRITAKGLKLASVMICAGDCAIVDYRAKDGKYYTRIFPMDTLHEEEAYIHFLRKFEIRESAASRYVHYFRDAITWLSLKLFVG